MIKTVYVTRRLVLRLVFVCVGILGFNGFRPVLSGTQDDYSEAHSLLTILNDPESANALGREYLRIAPEEANIDILVNLISSSQHFLTIDIGNTNRSELRNVVRRQLQKDFELKEIAHVHGWILSKTEVRLCALSALIA